MHCDMIKAMKLLYLIVNAAVPWSTAVALKKPIFPHGKILIKPSGASLLARLIGVELATLHLIWGHTP